MSNQTEQQAQVAVVTGAAGGFGSAIVKDLLQVGYKVAATDLSSSQLDLLKKSLNNHQNLETFEMDVTSIESIENTAGQISASMGSAITVLVNNAGIFEKNLCLVGENVASAKAAKRVIDINLTGSIYCTTVFSKFMARLKYGRIINIASLAGVGGASMASAYAASKAGLIKASESWARELAPLGLVITAIAPGICKTKMLEKQIDAGTNIEDSERIARSKVPVGRFGIPEDVSEVVTFLATCRTTYLNGAVINLDGGQRISVT